jgi:tryptophanyl-tRNA synthetase
MHANKGDSKIKELQIIACVAVGFQPQHGEMYTQSVEHEVPFLSPGRTLN